MTGMDTILELRRARLKPAAVFVNLVAIAYRDIAPLSASGIVTVDIGAEERISDMDFRPLTGLQVHVADFMSDNSRHRRIAALIAAVNPSLLVMPVSDGDRWVVYRRQAGDPARTETIRL